MAVYGDNYDYGESPYYKDEEAPVEPQNYYVDLGRAEAGVGTEEDPFNYPQFANYFNEFAGVDCGVVATDGDVLNLKGIANLIGVNSFLYIGNDIAGTITVKPWDWTRNGIWIVETKDNTESSISIVSNRDDKVVDHLILEGFAFLLNNEYNDGVTVTDIDYPGSNVVIEYKNHQIYCRDGHIFEVPFYDYTVKHNGFTFYCDTLTIDGIGAYPSIFQDGVVKANNIIEFTPPPV